jgi:hypothetical protein
MDIGVLGYVAASASGHEDLSAGLGVFFEQQHVAVLGSSADSGHQPSGSSADYNRVVLL